MGAEQPLESKSLKRPRAFSRCGVQAPDPLWMCWIDRKQKAQRTQPRFEFFRRLESHSLVLRPTVACRKTVNMPKPQRSTA